MGIDGQRRRIYLEECQKPKHGTTIILHLNSEFYGDDSENYTDQMILQSLVKKYSDYIRCPITMDFTTKVKPKDEDGRPSKMHRKKRQKRGP